MYNALNYIPKQSENKPLIRLNLNLERLGKNNARSLKKQFIKEAVHFLDYIIYVYY